MSNVTSMFRTIKINLRVVSLSLLCVLGVGMVPRTLYAAIIQVVPQAAAVAVGQTIRLDVVLDTESDSINAFQGELDLGPNISDLRIENGQSIAGAWLQEPNHEPGSPRVIFSGIIQNGFKGVGVLFSVFVSTGIEGEIMVTPGNLSILKNDGKGTEAVAKPLSGTFAAVRKLDITLPEVAKDEGKPLAFTPVIGKSQDLFEGNYFVMFNALDAGSGIDHYELLESKKELPARALDRSGKDWKVVANPAVLNDQNLSSFIYVRAVDRYGNTQVALVSPTNENSQQFPFNNYLTFGILIVLVVAGVMWFFFRRSKKTTNELSH